MRPQNLSSLDIYFMAAELANTLVGQTIKSIIRKANDVSIEINKIAVKFTVVKGIPYLVRSAECDTGKSWLAPVKGAIIENIRQVEMDRIIRFDLISFDRLGKKKSFNLYFEFFNNGNILLTDMNQRILASFRKITGMGNNYEIKPVSGFNILDMPAADVPDKDSLSKILSLGFLRYSSIVDQNPENLPRFIDDIRRNPRPHYIYNEEGELSGFAVYGPPFIERFKGKPGKSIVDVISGYVKSLAADRRTASIDYRKQIKKAEKKLKLIAEELAGVDDHRRYRLYGELILANLGKITKGQKECALENSYAEAGSGDPVVIALDPALSPERNAAAYFERARKLKIAEPIIRKRLDRQQKDLDRLIKLDSGEIKSAGAVSTKPDARAISKEKTPFRQYDLAGGWKIYAGKSARSNDELTFGFAKKNDLWFHAWQASGSHVILRAPDKNLKPEKEIILTTASLAAYLSKAKASSKVSVIYTEIRYVRKVKKVPGKAIYSNEKELMVEPLPPGELVKKK